MKNMLFGGRQKLIGPNRGRDYQLKEGEVAPVQCLIGNGKVEFEEEQACSRGEKVATDIHVAAVKLTGTGRASSGARL